MSYLKAQTGDDTGFKELIGGLLAHKEVKPHLPEGSSFTPEQVALIVIGAELTHKQFDHLCKVNAFSDSNYNSRKLITKGMREVENSLPETFFMARPFPGVCFQPVEYMRACLASDFERLEFKEGPLKDCILVMRAGDGSADNKFPMYNEAFNFPQDPHCQSIEFCHILALGRFVESVAGEKQHLSAFYEAWDDLDKEVIHAKTFKQAYGGDGSDTSKKKGMGGPAAGHFCDTCFANGTCKSKVSFIHPEIGERVRALREWEFEKCREAGKCVCSDFQCGKFLVQSVRDHAFDKYPLETMEGGRGKADGNRWDPEHMKHPRHDKIGEWAQKNAYGQAQNPPLPLLVP